MAHKTISIQGRIEICSIASLTRAYLREGHALRSKSDVLWRAVEQLSLMYERKHEEPRFSDVAEAIEYMDKIGLSLGTNARAMKSVLQATADETYFKETGEVFSGFATRTGKVINSGESMSKEEREAAARRIAEQLRKDGVIGSGERVEKETISEEDFKAKEARKLQEQREAINAMMGKKGEGDE